MSCGFETIDDLLTAMDGSRTGLPLHEVQAEIAEDHAMLTIFDGSGTVFFQSGTETAADPVRLESLKKATLDHLKETPTVRFSFSRHEDEPDWEVLGVRLDSVVALVAWDRQAGSVSSETPVASESVRKLMDALVGQLHRNMEENHRLTTRIEHFRAEQKALWESQTKAMEQAFEEREQRSRERQKHIEQLQSVMRMAGDAIITLDEDGVIESFNDEAVRMFGYQPDEAIGVSIDLLLRPMMPSPWVTGRRTTHTIRQQPLSLCGSLENYENLLQGKRLEYQGVHKQGAFCPVELTISEVVFDDRRIFTVILRDISARKEAELFQREWYHTQKLESIGKLAAEVAHEINTPTQYVVENILFFHKAFQMFSDPLRQLICLATLEEAERSGHASKVFARIADAIDAEKAAHLLEEIPVAIEQSQEGMQRVVRMVQSIKEFSHPDSEEKQRMDLNRMLENTVVVSRGEWRYVAVVETDLQKDLPRVSAFEGECSQVFLNLLVNAAQAIGARYADEVEIKGVIRIQTRLVGDQVEVRISDNGSGIPEEIQDRIFQPFFTTKPVGEGTGQGLAIAHSVIVKRHGGSLSFETEQDQGTTFIVRLPLQSWQDKMNRSRVATNEW